jgi:hypothetical protein
MPKSSLAVWYTYVDSRGWLNGRVFLRNEEAPKTERAFQRLEKMLREHQKQDTLMITNWKLLEDGIE